MIQVFAKEDCLQCEATKIVLEDLGVSFTIIDIDRDRNALEQVRKMGFREAPVVIVTNESGDIIDRWSGFQLEKLTTL